MSLMAGIHANIEYALNEVTEKTIATTQAVRECQIPCTRCRR